MDTKQLLSVLKRNVTEFLGVFPSDKLPVSKVKPFYFVANTDPSNKPGTHWVAVFVNADGTAEYFDSYGLKPNVASIASFLRQYKKCKFNTKRIQGMFSSVCGHYCVYYVIHRSKGIEMDIIAR